MICSVRFPSKFVLCFYKSTIRPGMEYCCHVWSGDPNCFLDILQSNLQKREFYSLKNSGSSSKCGHSKLVKYLEIFYLNWLNWLFFLILVEKSPYYSEWPFLDVIRIIMWMFSFLVQLDFGIICLEKKIFFFDLWANLQLVIDTCYLRGFFNQLPSMLFFALIFLLVAPEQFCMELTHGLLS